jgi:hypothetical protein
MPVSDEYTDNVLFEFVPLTKVQMRNLRKAYATAKTNLMKLDYDIKKKKMQWKREKHINDVKVDAGIATVSRTEETRLKGLYDAALLLRTASRTAVSDAKTDVSEKIDAVDTTVDGINTAISDTLDLITTAEDEITDLENEIKDLKNDIKVVLAADIESDVDDLQDNIDTNNDSIVTKTQWIRDAKTDLAKAKVTIDKYNAEIAIAKSSIRTTEISVVEDIKVDPIEDEDEDEAVKDDKRDDSDSDSDDDCKVSTSVVHKHEPSLLETVIDLLKPKTNSCDNTKETLTILLTAIQKQNNAVSHLVNNSELKKVNTMLENALMMLKK